ncbi:replicative DNA helicase [Marivivens donghaensis]|uniref:replicative DNA helicase n=1 Tax=Marivivens donghaensis TaxID=1699413 RepID=UPI003F6A3793
MSKPLTESTFANPDLERRCLGFLMDSRPSKGIEVSWAQIADTIPTKLIPDTIDNKKLFGLCQGTRLFHDPIHHEVFAHCARKLTSGDPVTVETIAESLNACDRLHAIGGKMTLEMMRESVLAPEYGPGHFQELMTSWVQRHALTIAQSVGQRLREPEADAQTVCAEIAAELATIADHSSTDGPRTIGEIAREVNDEIVGVAAGTIEFTGLKTCFDMINKASGGIHPNELIILAARPSVGKSAFEQQLIVDLALAGTTVAIVSLEMSERDIHWRNIASRQNVNVNKIRHAKLSLPEAEKIRDDGAMWENVPLIIDRRDTDARRLYARAKALKANHPGLRVLVVDYLQLVSVAGKSNRNNEVGEISRTLKILAGDLGITVIALSQLSRDGDKAGRRPKLSDLRDSGNIEQDADAVWFLHRDPEGMPDCVDFSIAKQRNGALVEWTPILHRPGHFDYSEIAGAGSGDGQQPGSWDNDYREAEYAESGDGMPF